MYSGIVQGTGDVVAATLSGEAMQLSVRLPQAAADGVAIGCSIGVDGVCLTAARISDDDAVGFDISGETMSRTTLGGVRAGDVVNIERSVRAGDEIGGHEMSGHVDGMLTVSAVEQTAENFIVTFDVPERFRGYVFNKGFIGIHGCSLTVADLSHADGTFRVHLIPETLRLTNLDTLVPGARVNVEIDRRTQVVVDTVRAYLSEHGADLLSSLQSM
jgi:riboflavin synthase